MSFQLSSQWSCGQNCFSQQPCVATHMEYSREDHLSLGIQDFYWKLVTKTQLAAHVSGVDLQSLQEIKFKLCGPKLPQQITLLAETTWCAPRPPSKQKAHSKGLEVTSQELVEAQTLLWAGLILYGTEVVPPQTSQRGFTSYGYHFLAE